MNSPGADISRLERVAYNRVSFWTGILFALIGLFVFAAIFNFIWPTIGANLSQGGLLLLGLIFSLVPAGLWLVFFYRLDRREPEPKRMVFNVFMVGLLLAAALYQPVVQGMFTVDSWLYHRWWVRLLGGILIVGFVEQFLVYLAVRYGVFEDAEFDERIDGVIYAIAAGLGFATFLNFRYVIERGGVDLDIGSIRMVVNALAHASFAGVLGYFIGQTRFEKTPVYYLPLGLTIAAVMNGLFFFIIEQARGGGLGVNPWINLIFATLVAVLTMIIVFWLVARANEETLRVAHAGAPSGFPTSAVAVPPLDPTLDLSATELTTETIAEANEEKELA
ncbi:MAG: PrsW family glutamic-type intramembrane protease [Chloroflexota bacterium]|nr:PrsW family glutamic-type intramembrane protease [Chloroflexota bacterium]